MAWRCNLSRNHAANSSLGGDNSRIGKRCNMLATSSTGLRSQARGAGGSGAQAQREEMLRQNNPSATTRVGRGCAEALSCGCVRKQMRHDDSSMSDLPSARTLHGHIHNPRDQPKAQANGKVRERRGRTKEQVRCLSIAIAAFALHSCLSPGGSVSRSWGF